MKIIQDLGVTNLNGTITRPRWYLLVECPECGKQFNLRKDMSTGVTSCKSCARKKTNAIKANTILTTGIKQCSICKQHLPISQFGVKSSTLSSYRSACKPCEKTVSEAASKQYRDDKDNKLKKQAYDKKYRAAKGKDHYSKLSRKWVSSNKDKRAVISKNYKAKRRLRIEKSSLTTKDIQGWLQYQPRLCTYCGTYCESYHIDHVEPLAKGGTHELENLTISCPSCNTSKNAKTLIVWMAEQTNKLLS